MELQVLHTILPDRGASSNHDGGLTLVLDMTLELGIQPNALCRKEADSGSCKASRNTGSLRICIFGGYLSQVESVETKWSPEETLSTFETISAGTLVYCWYPACAGSRKP
jgi:hypothetical protein